MKKLETTALLLLICLLCYKQAYSQESEKKDQFILYGNVIEKESELGVPYVTVRVYDSKRNIVGAISSDDKGRYTISLRRRGIYTLKYYAMGYSEDSLYTKVTEPGISKIGDIRLATGQMLSEARVVGSKSLITQEVDKLVYDVSLDPDAKKMKMSEIMKKIPHMQQTSDDGKLRYLYESIGTIRINGEQNDLISGSRQYPMNFIRGDVMSKIEIIMPNTGDNKTDKYIINIKLAREIPNGFAFQNTSDYKTTNRYGGNLDLASKTGSLYYSLNYGISYENSPKLKAITEKENNLQNYIQRDSSYSWNNNLTHSFILGLGTNIRKDHKIYLNLSAQKSDREDNYQIYTGKYDATQQLTYYNINSTENTLKNIPRLNAQISYSGFGMLIDFVSTNTFTNNLRSVNNNLSEETLASNINRISGSSSKKINNKLNLWLFASYSNRFYSNNSDYTGLDYKSNVVNALLNLQYIRKKCSMNLSFNLNNESITGTFKNYEIESEIDYNKLKFLPQLSIMYLSNKKYRFNFRYDISFTRPGLSSLNPFIDESDPENLIQGNPNLKPEVIHNFGIRVRKQMSKLFLSSDFSYKYTKGAIERLTELREDGKSYTTFGNIGTRHNYDLTLNGSYRYNSFTIWNNLTLSKNIYIDGDKNLNNSVLFISNRTSVSADITKATLLELQLDLRPQARSVQSKDIKYYSLFSLKLNQTLVKNKLFCGVSINDPFKNRRFLYSNIGNDDYRITTYRETIGRVISFNIRWNFGRFKEKPEGLGNTIKSPSDIYVP